MFHVGPVGYEVRGYEVRRYGNRYRVLFDSVSWLLVVFIGSTLDLDFLDFCDLDFCDLDRV